MPELPEVEVVCRGLRGYVSGKRIQAVGLSGKALRTFSGQTRALPIAGQAILGIARRAKNLVFTLDDWWLVVHLGMSGQLLWLAKEAVRPAHSHVWLTFDDGQLVYNDPRRFGDLRIAPRGADGTSLPEAGQGLTDLLDPYDTDAWRTRILELWDELWDDPAARAARATAIAAGYRPVTPADTAAAVLAAVASVREVP